MIIEVPDWCKIGKYIEFKMYDPTYGEARWFKDKIIAYSEKGFFHQGFYCPVYHHLFTDYGELVRECKE